MDATNLNDHECHSFYLNDFHLSYAFNFIKIIILNFELLIIQHHFFEFHATLLSIHQGSCLAIYAV